MLDGPYTQALSRRPGAGHAFSEHKAGGETTPRRLIKISIRALMSSLGGDEEERYRDEDPIHAGAFGLLG